MFLFRSLTIGLLGACVLLLIRFDLGTRGAPGRATAGSTPTLGWTTPVPAAATIIDVAPGVRGTDLSSLIHLAPDERVIAVDDRSVSSDLAAGMAIAERPPGARGYLDLEIAGDAGAHRRVLVLMH